MADARIYSTALTLADFQNLYAGTDVSTGLVAHWDFGDGPSANPADGDPVLGWISSDGTRTLLGQTTHTLRPFFKESLAALNSKPSLLFDGTDDYLSYANAYLTESSGTVIAVLVPTDVTAARIWFSSSDTSLATKYVTIGHTNGAKVEVAQDSAGTPLAPYGSTSLVDNECQIVVVSSSGTAYSAQVNSKSVAESWTGTNDGDWFGDSADRDNISIGAKVDNVPDSFFKGYVAHLGIYNVPLTAGQIARAVRFLAKKYGKVVT
jgi:hypothetical protein